MQPLLQELDAFREAGMTAELWWRDDNATDPSVELDRLVAMSDRHNIPCGLAAIPAQAGEPLRKAVSGTAHVWILQHGAGADRDADPHRPTSVVLEELRQGMLKFNQLFKSRFVPVLAPQRERIAPELLPYLPVMGYRGVSSVHGARRPVPPGDLRVADVYCDLLDRPGGGKPRFAGAEPCVAAIVDHLRAKRAGKADQAEPTGIRTHHMDMDRDAWQFLEALFELTAAHPAAQWLSPATIWPAAK
ncbi:MAG: hypothetical protein H0S80_15465 [Desulfovibrionaceae bacterium]|nr:hypothetical protein [Desulfovibrionaceae bacterium]